MFLVSQNIGSYDVQLPKNSVFRINLAWCNSLTELESKLEKNPEMEFFIDLPIGRIKPPNNRYTLDEIAPLVNKFSNIKYFAVSNVESKDDLQPFLDKLPTSLNIVPKIESPSAVENIDEICNTLRTENKIVMLDHDDLFSSIIRKNEMKKAFKNILKNL